MKRFLLLILVAMTLAASGQNFVTFSPLNAFTKEPLDSVNAMLTETKGDSTVIRARQTLRIHNSQCHLVYPKGAGKFTLVLEAPGYLPSEPRKFEVKKTTAYYQTNLGNILMDKDFSRTLDEVTVTATKIKMVMKGDTIVYNADAFQLAEGSVLDDLIKQLPGTVLKPGGVIEVNGKQVSSLLVNGRDFFKGDPKIALRNLPAYTVNTVKVYEKAPDYADLVKTNDKKPEYPLVMDVNLKKIYEVGWLGNVEAGYGTSNRYSARAFAMGYTKSTRIGLFANINNISNTTSATAASDGEWNPGWGTSGILKLIFTGANINWEHKQEKYTHKIDGSVKVTDEREEHVSGGASTNFYDSGDRYIRNSNNSMTRKTHIWVDGSYSLRAPRYYLNLSPYWEWMHTRNNGESRSATFTANPEESYRLESLDKLFSPAGSKRLEEITLLRTERQTLSKSDMQKVSLNWTWRYRRFNFSGSGLYDFTNAKNHEIYRLTYQNPENSAGNEAQRVYSPSNTNHYVTSFHADYNLWLGSESKFVHWQFIPLFDYRHEHSSANNMRYRLDRLPDWGADADVALGLAPSAQSELNVALDRQNSLNTETTTDIFNPGFEAIYGIFWKDEKQKFYVTPIIRDLIRSEKIKYIKPGLLDAYPHRTRHCWNPQLNISFSESVIDTDPETGSKKFKRNYSLQLSYSMNIYTPDLLIMINTVNNENPLYIREGNPDLRDCHIHNFNLGYYLRTNSQFHLNASANTSIRRRQIGYAQFYNRETGVTVSRPMNIDGNWNASMYISAGKEWNQKFGISASVNPGYNHSVDYISETDVPTSSLVHNWNIGGNITGSYRFLSDNTLQLSFNPRWMKQYSDRANFSTTSAWDFNYGVNMTFNNLLPWKLKFDTSFQLRTRTGYNAAEMNTTEYVWSAQLSRSFDNRFTLTVEGFDILGSVKNISRHITSQGFYENWYNALPSYVMAKFSYRFNVFPGKSQSQDH